MNIQDLIDKAEQVAENAYSPYSKINVGAIIETELGNLFSGCNVENASYGLTCCAERNAIFKGISEEGKNMKLRKVVIWVENMDEPSPCGACRQVISEFSGENTTVLFHRKGELLELTIDELLPFPIKL